MQSEVILGKHFHLAVALYIQVRFSRLQGQRVNRRQQLEISGQLFETQLLDIIDSGKSVEQQLSKLQTVAIAIPATGTLVSRAATPFASGPALGRDLGQQPASYDILAFQC